MAKKNELATIETRDIRVVPDAADLAAIMDELKDMDVLPFGQIHIAGGGAGVFKVTEPGADEPDVETKITAVIIASHLTNAMWLHKYGTVEDKTPDCASNDGEEGVVRETGEIRKCKTCYYNQFGSADGGTKPGKECKNSRRVYLLRPADDKRLGDVLPMLLFLPATALRIFDQYRVQLAHGRRPIQGVITKITLAGAANRDGAAYSTPVFEAVAALTADEAVRVKQYADAFMSDMDRAAVYDEPPSSLPSNASAPRASATLAAPPVDDDDGELPFG